MNIQRVILLNGGNWINFAAIGLHAGVPGGFMLAWEEELKNQAWDTYANATAFSLSLSLSDLLLKFLWNRRRLSNYEQFPMNLLSSSNKSAVHSLKAA